MSPIIPEQQPLIALERAAILMSSLITTRRTNLWKVAVVLVSTFLVGLGFSINATPSQKVYESVLCCQRHYDDCSQRSFVHETLCEKDNEVQSELADITSGLAGFGGFGIMLVPLWMALLKSQNPILSLFLAQLSAVLGEVAKAAIAFKNGGVTLRLMWLISPLEAAGGITYTVLVGSLIREITPPHFISSVMFFRINLEAHLTAFLGDALIASVPNDLPPFSCVCLGLAFQISGVLSLLLLGQFSSSPAASESMTVPISQQNDLRLEPPRPSLAKSILQSLLSPLKTLFSVPCSTGLLCLTSLIYNPLLFASSTLGRQYLSSPGKPQFNLGMSEISKVYASARVGLLVVHVIFACSMLMLTCFPRSLGASRRSASDLAVTGLLLLVASTGNIVLARAGSKGVFGIGLVLTGLGATYTSMVESMLAIRSGGGGGGDDVAGEEETTKTVETRSLLFTNQVVEAVGRVLLVIWLFSRGIDREGDSWKGEEAFYAAAALALLAALAVAFAAWLGEPVTRAVSGDADSEPRGIEDSKGRDINKALGDGGLAAVNAATPLLSGVRRGQTDGHDRSEI